MQQKTPSAVGVCFLFSALAVIGLAFSSQGLPTDPQDWLQNANAESGRLDMESREVVERVKRRAATVQRLIEGRIGLVEAAAWFRCYNEQAGPLAAATFADFPGATPEEKLCSQVIAWARNAAYRLGPSQQEELDARLARELAAARARGDGRIVLPAW